MAECAILLPNGRTVRFDWANATHVELSTPRDVEVIDGVKRLTDKYHFNLSVDLDAPLIIDSQDGSDG